MDRGRILDESHNVLVNVAGGPDMTLNEVQLLMDALTKHTGEETQILFGASVDPGLAGRMGVTLISSAAMATAGGSAAAEFVPRVVPVAAPVRVNTGAVAAGGQSGDWRAREGASAVAPTVAAARKPVVEEEDEEAAPVAAAMGSDEGEGETARVAEPEAVFAAVYAGAGGDEEREQQQVSLLDVAPESERPAEAQPATARVPRAPRQPRIVSAATDPQPAVPALSRKEERQETLQFEPVTRGRFEKSEPTIVDGQDLDVPTFLRRNLRVS
jgi:cell division protein FtsZ